MSDFVFDRTDGEIRFVGDFDGLYKAEDDPWGQSGADARLRDYYHHSRIALVHALHAQRAVGPGLEIGCGHGLLTYRLNRLFGHVAGIDISETALQKARERYPALTFMQGDITADAYGDGGCGFVIWAQVLWYVLHAIDRAVDNSLASLRPGGLLVISQAFLREQQYGREIVDGFDGAIRFFVGRFSDRMSLVECSFDPNPSWPVDDGALVFRKRG